MDNNTLIVAFLDVSFEFLKYNMPVIESKYKKCVFNSTAFFYLKTFVFHIQPTLLFKMSIKILLKGFCFIRTTRRLPK